MPADLQSAPFGHSGNLPGCRPLGGERNDRRRCRRTYAGRSVRSEPHRVKRRARWPRRRSFDIVSKVDRQEVDNALNQAAKEVEQRYDFKGTDASIEWSGRGGIESRPTPRSARRPCSTSSSRKLIKRGISLKSLEAGEPARIRQGVPDQRHLVARASRRRTRRRSASSSATKGRKGVKAQIQGDELRVQSQEPRRPAGGAASAQGRRPRRRRCSSSTTAERHTAGCDGRAGPGCALPASPWPSVPFR